MCSMKRVRLGVLGLTVAAMVLFSSGSAFGEKWKLTPPLDSPEPGASGFGQTTYRPCDWTEFTSYWAFISLKCQGLTPGATYTFSPNSSWGVWSLTADQTGRVDLSSYGWCMTRNELRTYVLWNSQDQVVLANQ
jgi:hypothetical protein